MKLFLWQDLTHEIVTLQHLQSSGDAEPIGDFAPNCSEAEQTQGDHRQRDAKWSGVLAQDLQRQGQEAVGGVQGHQGQPCAFCGEEHVVTLSNHRPARQVS